MNMLRYMSCGTGMILAILMGMRVQQAKAQVTTEVLWQHCFGGSDTEVGFRMRETSDGGLVGVGYGRSLDGDLAGSHGGDDFLVTKLDSGGTVQWTRTFGGSSDDQGFDILEASDGSIMVVGNTFSNDGDVTFNHGESDIWVLRLSPLGDMIWQKTYGGSGIEVLGQIHATVDGGFLIHASTFSSDGDVVGFHPGSGADNWVFKIDTSGAVEWSRAIGGSAHEGGGRLILTADGGSLVNFSFTQSSDGDISNYHGNDDCLVVKLSASGVVEWSRTIGGSQRDWGADIVELSNGDIIMVGSTASSDGDVALNHGGNDVLLARLNGAGDLIWLRTYGGSLNEDGLNVVPSADGGIVVASTSSSNDGDVSGHRGGTDAWVFKVDAGGSLVWKRSIGGSADEYCGLIDDGNGEFLLNGVTRSNDGDVQGNHGGGDFWLAKLSTNGAVRWQRCLGGSDDDEFKWVTRTSDGGYVSFGFSQSNDGDVAGNHGQRDLWAVKLKVNEPTEPVECALYIPNAFSPNGSNKNDAECIYGTDCFRSMSFNIYDRWGNKVYESIDPQACWDGSYNGQALDPAVFVYHLSATLNNGDAVEKQGNITLIK